MVLLSTPICDFGQTAADFSLLGVDGSQWTLQQCQGENGLLVTFICNHCPYVKSIIERIVRDARELQPLGINSVAIMSNDVASYPDDSFDNMRHFSTKHQFTFPYLLDSDQSVAKAYGAVCTPDFFGYNGDLQLQYRGRLDESRMEAVPGARRDLFAAMQQVAESGCGPKEQVASMGCSIKWR
ncbi:MAG: thioredoxin family protein [Candidatus Polarisedimenticolaceae bacterium]|nr:thioredoxin family protein [Candidatus Polarisedimenticolaceae bacterium]